METREDDTQDMVVLNVRISKKQLQVLRVFFTLTAIAGIIVFFAKHG